MNLRVRHLLCASLGAILCTSAAGQTDLDTEFEYASRLIRGGFADAALFLADRLAEQHPNEMDRVNVVRAEALILDRKLERAAEILKNMPADSPKTQAIKLALADGYYQVGKLDECTALYEEYFQSYGGEIPTDPDLLRFFRSSAHKFAQMLAAKNEIGRAAEVYDLVVKTAQEPATVRQVKTEQAELLTKAAETATPPQKNNMLQRAEANCEDVIWGGMDLWFGRAVTCLARITSVRGDREAATKLLHTNMEMLRALDDLLSESNIPLSESPFAGARSLLGSLYREEARLLLGPKKDREREALVYLDKALTELTDVWRLIKRTATRDQTVLRRNDNDASVLAGNRAERQEPFERLTTALESFQETLRTANQAGWDSAFTKRVESMTRGIADLREEVATFPKEHGVTPRSEMRLDEHSEVRKNIEYAISLLASDGVRRNAATDFLVKSLQQYYNVFATYPGSAWASDAGETVEELKEQLHALTGREVQITARERGKQKIALVKMHEGRNLFSRKEYAKAAKAYLDGLRELPEAAESLVALANLMECYVHLEDDLRVNMLARYVAERFHDSPAAPQTLLRIGRIYFEQKNSAMSRNLYEIYLTSFKDHHAAPQMLYMLGEQRWAEEAYDAAIPYYERLIKNYPTSGNYIKALNRRAWAAYFKEDFETAAEYFKRIVDEARPGLDRARGMICLADSSRMMEQYVAAVKYYRELTKWLSDKNNPYMQDAARQGQSEEIQDILEQAVFFQAYCLSRIEQPPERAPAYKKAAVQLYQALVDRFPNSELAPTALSSMGAILLIQDKPDEAAAAYEQLAQRYPDSDAGQNARFAMIRSLLDVDQIAKAKEVFEEMMNEAAKYPVEHFLRLGELLRRKDEYLAAIRAYTYVNNTLQAGSEELTPQQAAMNQRALFGRGQANLDARRYDPAISALGELIEKYPNSGMFYDARFLIAEAYEKMDNATQAIEVLRDIFQRAQDESLINKATMKLAQLQLAGGDDDGALASAQRIVLLGDPGNPKVRPFYEQALALSVRILGEQERWDDVTENAERYLELFPAGDSINEIRQWQTRARARTTLDGAGAGGASAQ